MRYFSFSFLKDSYILLVVFVVFALALVAFTHNSKEPLSQEKFSCPNAWSLQENLAHSTANQSACTIVATENNSQLM